MEAFTTCAPNVVKECGELQATGAGSESDDLPGVVVDQLFWRYPGCQVQTLAMEKRFGLLSNLIAELVQPAEIVFRNDANIRRLEGLPLEVTLPVPGRLWEPALGEHPMASIIGWTYKAARKTGFYLDQRQQHALVAKVCQRPTGVGRVLQSRLFCDALFMGRGRDRARNRYSAFDPIGQAKSKMCWSVTVCRLSLFLPMYLIGSQLSETPSRFGI